MKTVFTLKFNKFLSAVVIAFLTTEAIAICDDNADKLIKAYPTLLSICEDNHIIWKDGFKQLYDDGKEKNFQQLIESPDIEDMFALHYRTDKKSYSVMPEFNDDPGRIRNNEFFKHMYGETKSSIEKSLTRVQWMPNSSTQSVSVTTINGIDKKIQHISASLDALPKHLKKYVIKHAGTFNWRMISGTDRHSAHSFGIAIDINTRYSNYWKWNKKYHYQNQIPKEIVKIFEANGFIWGGKWYHYDTMHFEYRPELL